MPRLLTSREIRAKLKGLSGWRHRGKFIVKTFEFDKFMDGIAFLNLVARVAEQQEHHPDINVRYTTVRLSIQTHSEGGVTSWDIGLAKAIEKLHPKTHK
ncbi:MAG: 4a-hydroxytetrahydrobiopterin dehydratase [Nitrososphaerales archaeon]|nr:4a-hydroxytetrahydrobiopterin dehydratase [Nitrososphaerales archaeon]